SMSSAVRVHTPQSPSNSSSAAFLESGFFTSSSLLSHSVGNLDLAPDNVSLGLLGLIDNGLWYQGSVIVVQSISDTVVIQSKQVDPAGEILVYKFLDRVVHRDIHALGHAGKNEPRLYPVLIRVDADCKPPGLFDCIKYT